MTSKPISAVAIATLFCAGAAAAADPQPLTVLVAKDARGNPIKSVTGQTSPPPKVNEMHATRMPDGRILLDCDARPNPELAEFRAQQRRDQEQK